MLEGGGVIGVLTGARRRGVSWIRSPPRDLEMLAVIANQGSYAIRRTRLQRQLAQELVRARDR